MQDNEPILDVTAPEHTDDIVHETLTGGDGNAPDATNDAALLRELVLKAHPDVVPELVRGNTIVEMLASVLEAQTAYARIAAAHTQVSPILGGGTVRTQAVNVEGMSAMSKIRSGLGNVN